LRRTIEGRAASAALLLASEAPGQRHARKSFGRLPAFQHNR
jgi:hypothetical protein